MLGGKAPARAEIIRADYRKAIERLTEAYDLVFLDPPYRMEAAYGDALTRLRRPGCWRGALVILERAKRAPSRCRRAFQSAARRYGETCVEFIVEGEEA